MTSTTSISPKNESAFKLRNFVIPTSYRRTPLPSAIRAAAIVPTYKPGTLTRGLVEDLLRWNPELIVYVVDDATPREYAESHHILERLRNLSSRVSVLRTPKNKLKAGALNYALAHIALSPAGWPDVILSLDDDIVIASCTVKNLIEELMSYEHLGAVCSQCHVLNKNKNVLTRLQGLEYLGFNATRLADDGFYRGPLVMHGMLTAFRTAALREAGWFSEGHLIEDYEITTRLKSHGWGVKAALNAPAWTHVPEKFTTLWRQRTRWLYGGITVVARTKRFLSVLQDIIGHGIFFSMVLAIDLLIVFKGEGRISPFIADMVIGFSLLQFIIWYFFQLWLMRFYGERDIWDWGLRVSILPEFLYSNVLTIVQIGAYFFLFFNIFKNTLKRAGVGGALVIQVITRLFRACGYTESWGTRT